MGGLCYTPRLAPGEIVADSAHMGPHDLRASALRQLRIGHGIGQASFAAAMGLTQPFISQLEHSDLVLHAYYFERCRAALSSLE